MALNTIGEVETKAGASHRELSAHFRNSASRQGALAIRAHSMGLDSIADDLENQAFINGWKARGHSVAAFVQTATHRILGR